MPKHVRDTRRSGDARGQRRPARATAEELSEQMAEPQPAKREKRDFKSRDSLIPAEFGELSPKRRKRMLKSWNFVIRSFEAVLAVGCVLGLCLFLRPSVSAVENRTLTEFPALTWEGFVDGSWTAGISTWYADTFPFREQLMAADQAFKQLFGIKGDTQFVGGHQVADEIPTEPSVLDAQDQQKQEVLPPEQYNAADIEADIQGMVLDGAYLKDGACYTPYYFSNEGCSAYVSAITKAANDLGDAGTVYSILIPNNSGAMLPEADLAALGGSNQGDAIAYYYSLMPESVVCVPTMDTLRSHNSEYLYFKTDHHWTSLGAWYVYESFCKQKGITATPTSQHTEIDFDDFQGTFANTLANAGMGWSYDTVQAWYPNGTNELYFVDEEGNGIDWKVIQDVSSWNSNSKYATFIGGDKSWTEIHNPAIKDGSSCMVIKESYGNAFVPWLVDHYEHVYVVDFRYATINVVDFMKKNNVKDLIIINNITLAGGTSVGNKIESIV